MFMLNSGFKVLYFKSADAVMFAVGSIWNKIAGVTIEVNMCHGSDSMALISNPRDATEVTVSH